MELNDCIAGRRSIRAYKDEPVSKEIVDKIIGAGAWAPSGMNTQPWRFVVIENRATINKLSQRVKEILLGMEWPDEIKERFRSEEDAIFYGVPLLILVCVEKKEPSWRDVNLLDCGLAAENMFLAAYQEGLGSCFIGFGNFLNQDPNLLAEVGVPKDHELMAPLIFGYPVDIPEPKPREVKVLKWIR
ncbi:MAG: nitroreductase [Candidatus Altiarchaeota archaeon]|nr:nitroreductase [Candidatus Altiarchaeota archaeon]MBU4406940.1 nitroreductase [Candidatus Altiarchaeota archaeon]MBU4437008.1 nitroreductase [Candidatus Altiarchaeota archaeon]